jgi:WD40 repeat protein/serine/threonine protein kinase
VTASTSDRDPVERLAEEFAQRRRRGEKPTVEEYCDRHPDLADEIRAVFPALLVMEDLAPARGELTGPLLTEERESVPVPRKLGEYRLLREIGHGGMGVVYEAVQESLGRRVALKVLPFHALLQPTHLERFRREARAAARLHHTNIVPVFSVGEDHGVHYFAMQYIEGQGLDVVLEDLKRLRGRRTEGDRASGTAAASIAASLVTGQFAAEPPAAAAMPETVTATTPRPLAPPRGDVPATDPVAAAPPAPPVPPVPPAPAAGIQASFVTQAESQYFRSVARVGVQVADGLAYAHKQGILHRDIKPSNLLLDLQGTVWVTDFGLAKAEGAGELTQDGDVVGTLRYMPPERFQGWSDPRSDVYGLGITLYELLTLRPAFEESNRAALIERIFAENPPPPRRLDPRIPRDLETVVLKAIDKEPGRRYPTAEALAEDLRRFLADRPIQARRAGTWERLRKWARRRPAVAALGAALMLTAAALLVVGGSSYVGIRRALVRAEEARQKEAHERAQADQARAEAERLQRAEADQRRKAEAAQAEALRLRDAAMAEAYHATLSETRALRLVREPGWRYQALKNLQKLAQTDVPRRDPVELRGEAVAALLELDAREVLRLQGHEDFVRGLDFSPDGRTLASADYRGSVRLWDTAEGKNLKEIPNGTIQTRASWWEGLQGYPAVRFHPERPLLAYNALGGRIGFHALADQPGPLPQVEHPAEARALALDGRGRLLAVGWADGRVGVYDTLTRTRRQLLTTMPAAWQAAPELLGLAAWGARPGLDNLGALAALDARARPRLAVPPPHFFVCVALSPDGGTLAVAGPDNQIEVRSVDGPRPPVLLHGHRLAVRGLAFSPDGRFLASASNDGSARVWEAATGREVLALLGHGALVSGLAFNPTGSLLATCSDDQTARLWDTRSGRLLVTLRPGLGALTAIAFDPAGTRLALAGQQIGIFEITGAQELRRLAGHTTYLDAVAFDPLRPRLATGSQDTTVRLWDLRTGREVQRIANGHGVGALAFSGDGELLAVGAHNRAGTLVPPIHLYNLATGQRRSLTARADHVTALAFDPGSKRLAAAGANGTVALYDVDGDNPVRQWQGAGGSSVKLAFLDRGRQLLTASRAGHLVVFDTVSGATVKDVRLASPLAQLDLAPAGDRVAVLTADGSLRVLGLPDLTEQAAAQAAHPAGRFLAFSPDGAQLVSGADRSVHVWDARTLRRLYSLPPLLSTLHHLGYDPEGAYLALVGSEDLVTLVHLGLVRSELAGIGLDVNAPSPGNLPPVAPEAQRPAPARVVTAPPSETAGALALHARAVGLFRQRKWDELLPVALQAIEANPDPKELYQFAGDACYYKGQFARAAEFWQQHLDRCKDCPAALQRIGSCRLQLREYDKAAEVLERAVSGPHLALDGMANLAWLYALGPAKYRNVERALQYAERAARLVPDNLHYQSTLGRVYYRAGRLDDAVAALLKAETPADEPQNAANLLFLAMCYEKLNRHDEAKKAYQRAREMKGRLKLSPENERTWGDYQAEAEEVLSKDL